jgi:hypothetical protein
MERPCVEIFGGQVIICEFVRFGMCAKKIEPQKGKEREVFKISWLSSLLLSTRKILTTKNTKYTNGKKDGFRSSDFSKFSFRFSALVAQHPLRVRVFRVFRGK